MDTESVSSPAAADTHVAPKESSGLSAAVRTLSQLKYIPRFIGYARITYLVGLALALLVVSPIDWMPTPLLKIAVFATVLAVSVILFTLGGGVREVLKAPGRVWAIAVALALPLAYLLSWAYSTDRSVALTGVGNEIDTVLFAFIAALTFLLGFGLFRTMRSIKALVGTIGIAVIIAAIFQYVSILAGAYVLPAVFADKSISLVGKWNDFGMLMAIGMLFVLARLELGDDEGWRRYVYIAGLALLFVLIVLVQFNFIWWFTIAGAAVIALLKWLPQIHAGEAGSSPVQPSRIPWFAGSAAAVCLIFLVFGTAIVARLPAFLSVPSLEVRPSMSTTLEIASASHPAFMQTLVGTGPNTFTDNWLQHKPLSVNQTPFWSVDFLTGFSVLSTAFVTLGLMGVIAWLLPVVLVLMSLWQLRSIRRMAAHERLTLLSLGLASTFLWVGAIAYAGSQDMVLLAFATAGALWATEAAARRGAERQATVAPEGRLRVMGTAAVAFVLVLVVVVPAFASARQFLSYSYQQQAAKRLAERDIVGAARLTDTSQSIRQTGDNLRLGIAISFARMQELAAASTSPTTIDAMRSQFQAALEGAIVQGQRAATLHPNDYQAYASLGQVYEFLVPLKVPGAYESGQAAYSKAMEINPTNPTLPLLLARLEATHDLKANEKTVAELLNKSISLKPNYTDAFLFAEQVAVAQNDLPTATRAAEAAVASNPQNPALWFQLGLFYYTAANWNDAFKSFQNAVSLQGDYANAKYFLGLSAHKLGDNPAAMQQFRDLTVSNPDNAEVKLILSNLEAGKDPFAGQTPPQPPPEARDEAPVEE